jgi:hypothetical protein
MKHKKTMRGGVLIAVAAALAAPTALAAADFPSAVEQVLMNQRDGPVSRLSEDKKRELISCVNGVLADLPAGKKRFVAEAVDYDELEDRFGDVVMENRAEWKKKIARGCAHIVV